MQFNLVNLTATVHFSVHSKSSKAIDNVFIDNYKFTKYTVSVSPIHIGLSDQKHTMAVRHLEKVQ
jgi:hypothetical protein